MYALTRESSAGFFFSAGGAPGLAAFAFGAPAGGFFFFFFAAGPSAGAGPRAAPGIFEPGILRSASLTRRSKRWSAAPEIVDAALPQPPAGWRAARARTSPRVRGATERKHLGREVGGGRVSTKRVEEIAKLSARESRGRIIRDRAGRGARGARGGGGAPRSGTCARRAGVSATGAWRSDPDANAPRRTGHAPRAENTDPVGAKRRADMIFHRVLTGQVSSKPIW